MSSHKPAASQTGASSEIDFDLLEALNDKLAARMGLSLPRERLSDLTRGLKNAARELGESDVEVWARRLLSYPLGEAQVEVLARHLTIGETYFFRDERSFEVLREQILRPLIRERQSGDQVLRLWSAACSSGEEAYSLAILLHETVPRLADWNVTLLATDLNPDALQKARAGVYPQWSFRVLPDSLREKYFQANGKNRWTVRPNVQSLVKFAALNLAEDSYPSMQNDTHSMDVILCRNVLMYFADKPAQMVIEKLQRTLREGGYLLTSANEGPRLSYAPLVAQRFGGAISYRKMTVAPAPRPRVPAPKVISPTFAPPRVLAPQATAKIKAKVAEENPKENISHEDEARRLADAGELDAALRCCDAALQTGKLNARLYYLRATILLARGSSGAGVLGEAAEAMEAAAALRQALYLDPALLMAHLASGNLARVQGKNREATKHFANARHVAQALKSDEIIPESEGRTAAQLAALLENLP